MPGIWDQLTGAGQGGGFMSNPLLMAGLQTMGAANAGDSIGPAMARGFQGAQNSQMQHRQMQMQQLQMQNLAEDRQRTQAQRARLEGMAAPAGVEPSVWDSIGPDARQQVAVRMMTQAPDAPSQPSAVQEYQFAQSQGYEGPFQQWKTENRQPLVANYVGGQQGSRLLSPEEKTARGLAPDAVVEVDPKGKLRIVKDAPGGPKALSGESASRLAQAASGLVDLRQARDYFVKDGEFSQLDWAQSLIPGTEANRQRAALKRAIQHGLRIKSGATLTADELEREADAFLPSVVGNDAAAIDKFTAIESFLGSIESAMKPGAAPSASRSGRFAGMTPDQMLRMPAAEFDKLTDAEVKEYNAVLDELEAK